MTITSNRDKATSNLHMTHEPTGENPLPPQNHATFATDKATANLHITHEPTGPLVPPKHATYATFATDSHKCYISLRL